MSPLIWIFAIFINATVFGKASFFTNLSPMFEQERAQPDRLHRVDETRPTIMVWPVYIRSSCYQEPHHVQVRHEARRAHGRGAAVAGRVDVGAGLRQHAQRLQPALYGGAPQRRHRVH